MKLNENIELHDTLNPKLWDTSTNRLLPEVHDKILEIVSAFEDYVDMDINIIDIQLVGSNCSYNYSDTSDLDVHIITNFETLSDNPELVQSYYNAKKSQFNNNFDITIHGVEIEMYVQDVNSGVASNGIYSVCDNDWVKLPKRIRIIPFDTTKELSKWKPFIDKVLHNNDYEEIRNTIDRLYLIRHNSIAKDGEHSKGNQLFKDLRSLGYLDKLNNASNKVLAKNLSLESLEEEYDDDMTMRYLIDKLHSGR